MLKNTHPRMRSLYVRQLDDRAHLALAEHSVDNIMIVRHANNSSNLEPQLFHLAC